MAAESTSSSASAHRRLRSGDESASVASVFEFLADAVAQLRGRLLSERDRRDVAHRDTHGVVVGADQGHDATHQRAGLAGSRSGLGEQRLAEHGTDGRAGVGVVVHEYRLRHRSLRLASCRAAPRAPRARCRRGPPVPALSFPLAVTVAAFEAVGIAPPAGDESLPTVRPVGVRGEHAVSDAVGDRGQHTPELVEDVVGERVSDRSEVLAETHEPVEGRRG